MVYYILHIMYKISTKTEGIKYIGSKRDVVGKIITIIHELSKHEKINTVLDGFSGSTRVSQALANNGYTVISNDTAPYSRCFAECYLKTKKTFTHYEKEIELLNSVEGYSGWFSQMYGSQRDTLSFGSDGNKKMWRAKNSERLDAIADLIHNSNRYDYEERNVLLTSLILALDKVDNSLGHQVSYLKSWSARSSFNLKLTVPMFIKSDKDHSVYSMDIFDLLDSGVEFDLAYYDPPYSSNNEKMPSSRVRYASYYHIWTTIVLNDRPNVFGKCNRRVDTRDTNSYSCFEDFRKHKETNRYVTTEKIQELIEKTNTKIIIMSYSSRGRTSLQSIRKVLNSVGVNYIIHSFKYKTNPMGRMTSTGSWVTTSKNDEYLIVIDKTNKIPLNNIEYALMNL